ncbi:hypothetical protein TRIUR3_17155 [Triticum urartu]|uniref:FRIGIDA-like protein n=1 Tax=Triticum urartu TaxID=4572 RepID=M7Z2E3_TRIUA|nr:hypothetical protein TRIUR3_17155 [Triticum urartu]
MESASAQSAAAKIPIPTPSPPIAQSDSDQPPKAMATAEVEAAIAALPARKEALREAFDRLAACSPFPLPFTWGDLDVHISSLQSSISLRHRQLRVLEGARSALAVPAPVPTGKRKNQGDEDTTSEEEEVEEEEYEEVMEEVEEEVEVEVEEEVEEEVEVEEDADDEEVVVEEEEEEEVVEIEEDEVDANNAAGKPQKDGEQMLEAEEEKVNEHKVLEASDEAERDCKVEKDEEEPQVSDDEMGDAKDEQQEAKKVSVKKVCNKDLVAACSRMNVAGLVNIVFNNNIDRQEYPVAMCNAKDAAALVLDVVRIFLPKKQTKTNRIWENCVALIRCVPAVAPKLSVRMIDQAKLFAKYWKKKIGESEICGDHGMLDSWAFLNFIISYNIVSEFDVDEIIRLYGTVPRKYQKKNCVNLCKGLGLVSRISDLIDYLIENGQQLSVIPMTQVLQLVDKYPPLALLEGYVEKAKGTALELLSKNGLDKSLNLTISKEIENLRLAESMVKQQLTDSRKSVTILEEINKLLVEYAKSRITTNASTTSTLNSRQQQKTQQQKQKQKYKKHKKEQQQHEGQDGQVQGKQRKLEGKQLYLNQPRPCVTKLPTPTGPSARSLSPVIPNVTQIGPIGHRPFDLMPAIPLPFLPGIQGGPVAANVVPTRHNPFQQNPLYRHPSFHP